MRVLEVCENRPSQVFELIPSESWTYLVALKFFIGRVSLLKLEQELLSFLSVLCVNKTMTFFNHNVGISRPFQLGCIIPHLLHYRFHPELVSLHKVKDNHGSDTDSFAYVADLAEYSQQG
jgi:hypothetical protein